MGWMQECPDCGERGDFDYQGHVCSAKPVPTNKEELWEANQKILDAHHALDLFDPPIPRFDHGFVLELSGRIEKLRQRDILR